MATPKKKSPKSAKDTKAAKVNEATETAASDANTPEDAPKTSILAFPRASR